MSYLNREEIEKLILEQRLVERYIDLKTQLQPNGFDLTVSQVFKTEGVARIGFSNENRKLPNYIPIPMIEIGYFIDKGSTMLGWVLKKGSYVIAFNEVVKIPLNLCARSQLRSTVVRCNHSTPDGFWESGYTGGGYTNLHVRSGSLILEKNARLCQIHFIRVNLVKEGYAGEYQNENTGDQEK